MKVFKFGGASVKDAAGIRNVTAIIKSYLADKPLIIVSASGKTTNALEDVVNAFYKKTGEANTHLEKVRQYHNDILDELFPKGHVVYDDINDIFAELDWVLEENPANDPYDYIYDQVVSLGELMSSRILAAYFNQEGIPTTWLDVRDVMMTDTTYREANVRWEETEKRMNNVVPALREKGLVVTQGFIGITPENTTTTLGREGSDFTAAIFSWALNADSMTIWKDVPGVLNADPRLFENAVKIDHLSYEEAIEMTYYGAQVIHPKTMRPLQNRNIPLYVKSFINPDGAGSVVDGNTSGKTYPPVIVVKKKQALMEISSNDFFFINEEKLSEIFDIFTKHRIKVNMMQNTAMKFLTCVDNNADRVAAALEALNTNFHVTLRENLELLTVRHYSNEMLDYLKFGKTVLLEEKIPGTVQIVVSSN